MNGHKVVERILEKNVLLKLNAIDQIIMINAIVQRLLNPCKRLGNKWNKKVCGLLGLLGCWENDSTVIV